MGLEQHAEQVRRPRLSLSFHPVTKSAAQLHLPRFSVSAMKSTCHAEGGHPVILCCGRARIHSTHFTITWIYHLHFR